MKRPRMQSVHPIHSHPSIHWPPTWNAARAGCIDSDKTKRADCSEYEHVSLVGSLGREGAFSVQYLLEIKSEVVHVKGWAKKTGPRLREFFS